MDAYVTDWLDLLLRWLHVVAAVVWIGTSFYFVALDNHLERPKDPDDDREGVGGESWEVHGGGFYRVLKYRVAPRRLPERLHWFKWEAYTTWLSGFALMVVLYYWHADTYLGGELSQWTAIGVSVGGLVAAWLVYDVLCRISGSDGFVGAAVLGLTFLAGWGFSEVFVPRAVAIQLGAMLGTIMVANVFFVIIPAHWDLVRAKEQGREPDPRPGVVGKQRSVHNNYLTLPVVLAMLGGHFPAVLGRQHGWALLVGLMAIGALVRHYFNLRHRGWNVWPIPLVAGLAVLGVAYGLRPEEGPPARAVSFAEVEGIVEQRCLSCHVGAAAPAGLALDDPETIRRRAGDIAAQVASLAMPPGNTTGMTDAERQAVVAWAARR